jgi:PEP-CTERM motif
MLSIWRTLGEMPDLSSDRMTHLELSYHRYLLEATSFMKTSTTKNSQNRLKLTLGALSAVSCAALSQPAAAVSLGGYTWNAANAVTSGVQIPGSQNIVELPVDTALNAANTVATAMGRSGNTLIELGNSTGRSIVQLDWSGALLTNRSGNDLVVYESGNAGAPEAFAVAVRRQGQTDFTNFLHRFSTSYTPETDLFATGFDLSDFGLGEGDAIDAIRIANLIGTDRVSGDGQGFLGGESLASTGPQGGGEYPSGRFDPDIAYVVGLHDVVRPVSQTPERSVPEPSSMLGFLAVGAFGVNLVRKRKQQQKA